MKVKIMSIALLLSLTQFSFAATPKPDSCPSVSALQAVGVTSMLKDGGRWYGFVQSDNYSTKEKWTFNIGAFKAKDENDAKHKAMDALTALTFDSGPLPFDIEGIDSWACLYKDQSGHIAGTITPTINIPSWIKHI